MNAKVKIVAGILTFSAISFGESLSLDSIALSSPKSDTTMVVDNSVAVLEAKKAQLEAQLTALSEAKKSEETTVVTVKNRKPRTGGAGGFTVGFVGQDMAPIKDMITRREIEEKTFTSKDTGSLRIGGLHFNSAINDREIFPTLGFTGYAAFDGGFRVGGTVRAAAQFFTSTRNDSLFTMIAGTAWTGLLLEQAFFPSPKTALVVGGHIGSGGLGTIFIAEKGTGSGLSETKNSSTTSDSTFSDENTLKGGALFFLGELHTGATISLLPWLHLGGEFTTEFKHSARGFNWSDGFTTVNPGGSFRIMFGRAG